MSENIIKQKSHLYGLLFLFCAVFANPALFTRSGYLPLMTSGALGLTGAGILLISFSNSYSVLKRLPLWMKAASGGFFLLILFQYLLNPRLSPRHLGEALLWLAVPLMSCVFYQSYRKWIPFFGTLLWGLNIVFCLSGLCRSTTHWASGITGNENWTAALLVMGTPLAIHLVFQYIKNKLLRNIISIFSGMIALLLLILTGSKGAILALFLCLILVACLKASGKMRRILAGGMLLCVLAGAVWLSRNMEQANRFLMQDGRIVFYESAVNLIKDHPVFGVGQGNFENEYMKHRVPDYWFIFNPSARSNHPHNHFLFIASSYGLAGLLLWLMLLLLPLWKILQKIYKRETLDSWGMICFYLLIYALIHGSLDLILFSWPTNLLALFALGFLWNDLLMEEQTQNASSRLLSSTGMLLGIFLMGSGIYTAWQACYAALQARIICSGQLTKDEAEKEILNTIRKCPNEYQANFALMRFSEKRLRDPATTLLIAEVMQNGNIPDYPGVHIGKGNALLRLGRFEEAIREYTAEAGMFPFTLKPVYNMVVAAKMMQNSALATQFETVLRERMKVRNLNEQHLRKILMGRDTYDLRAGYKPE